MMEATTRHYTEGDIKHKKARDLEKNVMYDKQKIYKALTSNDEESMRSTHRYIDGKYSAYVPEWSKGMYGYILEFGFNYELLDETSLIHNLELMKAKLEGYAIGFERPSSRSYAPSNNINVSVNNTNDVNVTISFEHVRRQIEDMSSLTNQETEEILAKIDELEEIINSNDKKKSKWEKTKPVLVWLANKSFDVGIALLPLLLKIQG